MLQEVRVDRLAPLAPVRIPTELGSTLFARIASKASNYFEQLISAGFLERRHLSGTALDFGCGCGGASVALAINGARVTAIDKSLSVLIDAWAKCYLEQCEATLIEDDGITYLQNLPAESLDIVTAFLFGPDSSGETSSKFFEAAQHALKNDGRLVITSDHETIANFSQATPKNCGVFLQADYPNTPSFVGGKVGSNHTWPSALGNMASPPIKTKLSSILKAKPSLKF